MKELTSYEIPDLADLPKIFTPYLYRLVIHPIKPREKSQGGIILSTQSQQDESLAQQFGIVVAMGETAFKSQESLENIVTRPPKVGDVVMYFRFAGQGRNFIREKINEDGEIEDYRMMFLNDIDIAATIDDISGYRLR